MKTPKIPKGWYEVREGAVIKRGDQFVNCEGRWIKTSDAGRKVGNGIPWNEEYKQWSGIYIRYRKAQKG